MENRIQSAESKLTKLQETLAKKTGSLEKAKAKFADREAKGKIAESDRKEFEFSVSLKEDDLDSLRIKIAEAEKHLAELRKKAEERKAAEMIPECFEGFRNDLAASWDEYDKKKRARLREIGEDAYCWIVRNGRECIDYTKYNEYKKMGIHH